MPNPTTEKLKIESGKLKIESIEIYDIYGRNLSASCPPVACCLLHLLK